jgi:hypothetical protein
LAYRTNRIIGGVAPSEYLAALERGKSKTLSLSPASLDEFLASHLIDPSLLRADDFQGFMADRQMRLLRLIEQATGKQAYAGPQQEEGIDVEEDEDAREAELTIAAH